MASVTPKIFIITPCCRPANLETLYESINFDLIHRWYIVYDTSRNRTYRKRYPDHPKIVELECSDVGSAGHPQRNLAMKVIEDGMIYFLDDDTIMHPDIWSVMPTLDGDHYYTWDQLRNKNGDNTDWALFKNEKGKILRGNVLKLQHIDTAQFIFPKKLIGSYNWKKDDYKADGLFMEYLHARNPSAHVYIPKVLCYYNSLVV